MAFVLPYLWEAPSVRDGWGAAARSRPRVVTAAYWDQVVMSRTSVLQSSPSMDLASPAFLCADRLLSGRFGQSAVDLWTLVVFASPAPHSWFQSLVNQMP